MQSQKWMWRGLLIFAVAAPAGLFTRDRPPPPPPKKPPPPSREVELQRVYDAIPDRRDFDRLAEWCALPPREATADEAAVMRAALPNAVEPVSAARDPLWGRWANDPARRAEVIRHALDSPHQIRWVRISDPASPARWIGLVVRCYYNTAQCDNVIVCRVAVGF